MSAFFRFGALGRILTVGQCPDGDEHFYEFEGETLVVDQVADAAHQWYDVEAGQLIERETPGIAADGTSFTGIPVPCELRITGPVVLSATLDESGLDITFDVPGTYTLEFIPEHPRWLTETRTLEVPE